MTSELVLTLLRPDRMRERPQRGVRVVRSWGRFTRWLALPAVSVDKAGVGGFVLADLRDGIRQKAHVLAVTALAFDHDAGTVSLAEVSEALGRYAHAAYTTASHEPHAPRWRAIVALSRPLSTEEHGILWRHAERLLASNGIPVDPSAKDPCRLWYCPTVRPTARFGHVAHEGEALDVDQVLALARTIEATRSRPRLVSAPAEHGDRYIAAALRRASDAVAGAPKGARNDTLNREAHSLARLGDLPDETIERVLAEAATAGGLSPWEAKRTIASALRARRQGVG